MSQQLIQALSTQGAENWHAFPSPTFPAGRRRACRRIGTAKCRTYDVCRPDCNIRERRGWICTARQT